MDDFDKIPKENLVDQNRYNCQREEDSDLRGILRSKSPKRVSFMFNKMNNSRKESDYSSNKPGNSSDESYKLQSGQMNYRKQFSGNSNHSHKQTRKTDEKLSIHYLKSLIKKKDHQLIENLLESEVGFRKLVDSPIRYEHMSILFAFISRLCSCSIEYERSKEVFLGIVLCSEDFFKNIFGFTVNIIEFSRSDSQLLINLDMMSDFFFQIVHFIPKEQLRNYTLLLSKALDISMEIDILSKESIQNFEKTKEILFKKIEFHEEELINYQSLSVFPTFDEIFNEKPLNVESIIKGPYINVAGYIDTQFKLLKEDYVSGLRNGIQQYLKEIEIGKRISFNHDIFVYKNVVYTGFSNDDNPTKKVMHTFTIDSKPLKKIDWKNTKRLIHGSLLVFSYKDFKTVFLGVLDNFEILDSGQLIISVAHVGKALKIKKFSKLVMIESRVFFEPYYQVCSTLKSIHPQLFPMCKYVIFADTEYKSPKYLKQDSKFVIGDYEVSLNNPESWPGEDKIGLNKSQITALRAALTREFVVIQGPPGTGKTYLGIKIINILLDNKEQWSDGQTPIFVVCYRNGAVDQILEAVSSNTSGQPRKVVRLGNRSTSEKLKDCTLKNTVGHRRDPSMFLIMNDLKEKLATIKLTISQCEKAKLFVQNKQGILNYQVFGNALNDEQKKFFALQNCYENWLLGDGEDKGLIYDDEDELVNEAFDEVYNSQEEDSVYLSQSHPFVFLSIRELVCELMDLYDVLEYLELQGTSQIAKNFNLFVLYDNKMNILRKVLYRLHMRDVESNLSKLMTSDLQSLTIGERWTLYNFWSSEFFKACDRKIEELLDSHDRMHVDFLFQRDTNDGENLRAAGVEVVGATTTGAARLNKLLASLKPKIVIIEEAAEILEAHTITSLTEHCEHLILIGDHKQLKPSPASYASSEKYHMDISLFERMILNGMECFSLTEQHRMRPEISALITPYFYKNLTNHPNVDKYPDLMGVKKNMFFLDHQVSEDELVDSDSHKNEFEAEFILQLASYIIQQGYDKSKVTVLTFYVAQLLYMKSIKFRFPLLEDVLLEVVDNFQGEENDIILLSSVRSNSHTIGFLAKQNRICVALSRAKIGFIMIGNMETLQVNSEVWKVLREKLIKSSSVDKYLPLKCQTHKKITKVKTAEDFHPLLNGGCTDLCGIELACGHICSHLCHPLDTDHMKSFKCNKPCLRKSTCNIHQCPAECGEDCPPCQVKISIILECGHDGSRICGGEILKCTMPCHLTLQCGHLCPKKCHLNDDTDHSLIECKAICGKPIATCIFCHKCPKSCREDCGECSYDNLIERPCGHIAKGKCSEISKSGCKIITERELLCGHIVEAECHLPLKKISCTAVQKVLLDCSHEVEAICGVNKKYIKCDIIVEKVLPCTHKKETLCSNSPENVFCDELVNKTLKCGHVFENAACSKSINELSCEYKVQNIFDCGHEMAVNCGDKNPKCSMDVDVTDACGHTRSVPCYQSLDLNEGSLVTCKSNCNKILPCKHKCEGTCGSCMQGRVHVACNAVCGELMICGHKCSVKCWNDFHSCRNRCINSCKHKRCKRDCGEMCDKCMEPCGWKCKHFKCTRKCWEVCNRPPCEYPCPLNLRCNHPCFGLCGEPCPPLCLLCSPQKNLEISDRYILLEDCDHIASKKELLSLIENAVGLIRCPKCNIPVVRTNFVRSHTKMFFSKYSRVRSTASEIYNNRGLILREFSINFRSLNDVLQKSYEGCDSLNELLYHLLKSTLPIIQRKKVRGSKLSLKTLLFICFYVTDVLQMTQINEIHAGNSSKILEKIDHLASYLLKRAKEKISPREMFQFTQELSRLKCIVDVIALSQDLVSGEAMDHYKEVERISFSHDEFTTEDQSRAVLALSTLKRLILSNHQLLSNESTNCNKIIDFFKNYFAISYHSDKWLKCESGHCFYLQEYFEAKCPVCCNKKKNSLYFVLK